MSKIRRYELVQEYTSFLRHTADFEQIHSMHRDSMIERLAVDILTEQVAEETYVISEEPHWKSANAHYVASLPEGYRKRFLMHFWDLTPEDLVPKVYKHIITLNRWTEHPDQGIPKQKIEETMGYWA